jgi:Icc-related predicted phosphoesterase
MRIYAVADVHGRPDRIDQIRKNISRLKPAILVIAGDITNYKNSTIVIQQLNAMPIPVLAIRGNTDWPRVDKLLQRFPNTASLHLREHIVNGIGLVGVSGTIPLPFRSKVGIWEQRIMNSLGTLVNTDTILVTHTPPLGILDKAFNKFHAGSRCLYKFILERPPKMLLCGHIHECPGIGFVGKTLVVNCSMARNATGAIIEIDKHTAPKVEMVR